MCAASRSTGSAMCCWRRRTWASTSRRASAGRPRPQLPLCLLVPEMQNRRIVDAAFATAGRQHLHPWSRPTRSPLWSTMSARPAWSPWRPTHLVAHLGLDASCSVRCRSSDARAACTRWAWWWPTASPRRRSSPRSGRPRSHCRRDRGPRSAPSGKAICSQASTARKPHAPGQLRRQRQRHVRDDRAAAAPCRGLCIPGKGKRRGRITARGRQVEPDAAEQIRALLGDRPRRRDLLIEFLHLIQDRYGPHLGPARRGAGR